MDDGLIVLKDSESEDVITFANKPAINLLSAGEDKNTCIQQLDLNKQIFYETAANILETGISHADCAEGEEPRQKLSLNDIISESLINNESNQRHNLYKTLGARIQESGEDNGEDSTTSGPAYFTKIQVKKITYLQSPAIAIYFSSQTEAVQ